MPKILIFIKSFVWYFKDMGGDWLGFHCLKVRKASLQIYIPYNMWIKFVPQGFFLWFLVFCVFCWSHWSFWVVLFGANANSILVTLGVKFKSRYKELWIIMSAEFGMKWRRQGIICKLLNNSDIYLRLYISKIIDLPIWSGLNYFWSRGVVVQISGFMMLNCCILLIFSL